MKILIIDDHPLVSAGLARLLALEFDAVVLDAATADEGLRLFRVERPDVTILDLNLPDRSGLALVKQFREAAPSCPVLVLSMMDDGVTASACLDAGAAGYVSKSAAPGVVLDGIRAALDGGRYLEPALADKVRAGPTVAAFDALPPADLELLRLIMQGLRGSAIAVILGVSEKTVANRKSMLRAKLGALTDIDMMRMAGAAGLNAG